MAKSFSELQTLAIQIRDELNKKKNSAQRVGSALLDIIDNCIQNITDIKQKLSVFEHACSGFKRVSSEAQLPVTPSQEDLAKGFLVNTSLYLYVGTGGNAVNGRYFNVGDIRGPQGEPGSKGETGNTGPTGEKGEQGNSGVTGDTSDIVVINNLDGGESEEGSIKVLAAEQGKVLNKKFTELNSSTKIINLTDKITWSYTDGNKTTSVDWIGSETLIKVVPYSILYFSKIWDENINFVSIQLYDKNKLFISAYRNITREKLHFIEIEDIWYISINFHAKSSDKNNIIQKSLYQGYDTLNIYNVTEDTKHVLMSSKFAWSFNSGSNNEFDDWIGSEYLVKVIPGSVICVPNVINFNNKGINIVRILKYNLEKEYLGYEDLRLDSSKYKIPSNTGYIAIDYHAKDGDKNSITYKMFYFTYDTSAYGPYEEMSSVYSWNFNNGTLLNTTDWIGTLDLIKVIPGGIIEFAILDAEIDQIAIVRYDENKQFISGSTSKVIEQYTIPEDTYYIGVDFHAKSSDKNNIIQKFFYYLFKVGDKSKGDNVYWTAIGDSITAGNSENTGESYATFAQLKYGDNVVLQKLGYWGHTMGTLRTAYNTISEECDIVTVNFGANDYPSNWDSLSVDDIVNKTIEDLGNTTFENLCWFIKTMKKNRPKVSIFILTPIKRGGPAFSTSLERQGQFVDMEIELCKRLGIPVIDLHNNVPIDGQDATYQLEETSNSKIQYVHPNNLGRNIIANYIVSVLNIPYH